MSPKEKIVHQQQFQNAQQTVEVIVKAKPKPKLLVRTKSRPKQTHFTRNCILKRELEKLALEEKQKTKPSEEVKNNAIYQPGPLTNIEISKKSSNKREKQISDCFDSQSLDMTWKERLENCSSLSHISSQVSRELNIHHDNRRNLPQKKSKKSVPIAGKVKSSGISAPPFCNKIGQAQVADVSIQTSPPTEWKRDFHLFSSQKKNASADIISTNNHVKTSANQTHSPFGDSALKLLHELRERLRSQGDSEGSQIVNAIEAYFETGSKPDNNAPPTNRGWALPRLSSLHHSPDLVKSSEKDEIAEKLKRTVEEQQRRIENQTEVIRELRSLSDRLLAFHEMVHQNQQTLPEKTNVQADSLKTGERPRVNRRCEDDGVDTTSSKNLQKILKDLAWERDAALKEVKSQREVILNLEIKLAQLSTQTATEDKQAKVAYSVDQAPHGNEYNSGRREGGTQAQPEVPVTKSPTDPPVVQCPSVRGPVESEVDSAFEEKSSRSVSNMHSPSGVVRRFATGSGGLSSEPVSRRLEDNSQPRNLRAPHSSSDWRTLQTKSDPRLVIFPHEFQDRGDLKPLTAANNYAVSFISDVSDAQSDPQSVHHREGTTIHIPFSETPLMAPTSQYLESTRVRDLARYSGSPSKPAPQSKPNFELDFISESSCRLETNSLRPEPCSHSDIED